LVVENETGQNVTTNVLGVKTLNFLQRSGNNTLGDLIEVDANEGIVKILEKNN
jgi:hypothetical protein|tara:strand:- start:1491 stop:1649 length:159 start_codon:yes stop_codon:yes gene_type:complete